MAGSTESNARMQELVNNHGPNGCPPGYRKIANGDCVKIDIDPFFHKGPSEKEIRAIDPFHYKGPDEKTLRNIDPGFYKDKPDTITLPDWMKNLNKP